ncbi:MAG TPA: universal stress protein [Polyangia bacterium]|nr:universal stress protein [Polyangia bacterium]
MNELIVCATDFSPQAEAALAWAAALARRAGARVDLVHVARPYREDSRTLVFEGALVDAANVQAVGAKLRAQAEAAARQVGVSIRSHVLRGEPHEAILAHARREEARLVVVGTCGLASVERWMLGSVAERLVRVADRPVVLVPRLQDPTVWAADAPRAPRVVAGLGEHDDVGLRRFLAELRRGAACDVTFAHLYWPLVEYARLGLPGPRDPVATDPDVVKSLEPALRRRVEGLPGRGEVALDVRPAWGDTTANLLVAAEDHAADLLVVGVEHRHGLGAGLMRSIAERLALQSRYVPIACIPAEPAVTAAGIPSLRSVLAVTDFSELGNAAIPHAYALLRGRAGVVELAYVHERALPSPAFAYEVPEWRLSDLERAALVKDLRGLVPREAASLGIMTHVSVIDGGRAAEAIVQASERLDVDALCLASHGRGGLARTVLGSVAAEVVHRARRPVLVVRKA